VPDADGQLKPIKEVQHNPSLSKIYRETEPRKKQLPAGMSKPKRRHKKPVPDKGKGKGRALMDGSGPSMEPEGIDPRSQGVQMVAKLRSQDMAQRRRYRPSTRALLSLPPLVC
jgi:hypothetical protein